MVDKSTPVSGSSSIPNGVIFFGSGVNVESGLSSVLLSHPIKSKYSNNNMKNK